MSSIAYYPEQYEQLLENKVNARIEQFSNYTSLDPQIVRSQTKNYRMRAEFRVWHDGDDLYYIMFDPQTRAKFRVDQFPPASALINQVMLALIDKLKPNPSLRHKLFQVDFLSSLSGQILVSLLYHKQLDEQWQEQATLVLEQLRQDFDIDIIGRAKKQKVCLEREYVIEKLQVNEDVLTYQQVENSFTQPNALVNQKMLEWSREVTTNAKGDLLELYCGNGNFSIALAKNFSKVLATELAKPSVNSAQFNIQENNIDNLKIIRLSAEEFTQAINKERSFRRLEQADVDLDSYECDTILVDPPRAGLDSQTCSMVSNYQAIVYISCNPDTLHRDLEELSKTHEVSQWAMFDQFPYTHHIEMGVYLTRR
ncbi:tRNA (uridine(54)-C5)-methyltransferase TrmA [Alginatibacterium sediminis]|uniref:tRNA/tmRNA (uracil-C(5))-methyltransferase n=1 Tax=Alginatibacterium sediminis TaxID=2164068 RepID=A0A420E673_9ALTE|nr:tRNA (uridine(54)-C5)-methyltransferase TrmA [Alginatibacterium sediminis]RKF13111.1 tRNA (uridine(54)-C5)-methyltransferase TrmA [Alginatibacterium sediminis]